MKKLLGQVPAVLVTAGKREENPPCQMLTPRLVRVLESVENSMYFIRTIDINTLVSSMAPDIHYMNERSWGGLVLSIMKSGLLSTASRTPQIGRNLTDRNIKMLLLIMHKMI